LTASVPVVALVQDVERPHVDRNAFQELDHIALFAGCAKWVRRLADPARADDYVDMAFTAAASGRPGPAVLLLPADVLREPAVKPARARALRLGAYPIDRPVPTAEVLDDAARAIASAEHPVILAGGGCVEASAQRALAALQGDCHLPVFTTNMGKGAVVETHPLSAGVLASLTGPGSLGRHTRPVFADADLVLLAGTRTNQNGTDSWRLLPRGAQILHIDVDPLEVGRTYEAMRLVGDAAATLGALHRALLRQKLGKREQRRASLESRLAQAWETFDAGLAPRVSRNDGPIRPERVMAELQGVLPDDATVVADASYSSMWVVGQLRSRSSRTRYLTPRGLAGLGWGLPLAMGAKVAVVAVVGDGGFAHSWAELETMVRMSIPVVVLVLNNGVLGYQRDAETVKFGAFTSACTLGPVDHAALASACGCAAQRVDQASDLRAAIAAALEARKPHLLEIMCDPDAHPPLSLYDGTLDVERLSEPEGLP
jgi:acetolactate synthase-1/2/3 large subunit